MASWKNARTRREVRSRAGESLRERADPHRPSPGKGEAPSLLDIALNHLTLGRAALYAGADGGFVRRVNRTRLTPTIQSLLRRDHQLRT